MENTTMTIAATHCVDGVAVRDRFDGVSAFIAPTAWITQGTGLPTAGSAPTAPSSVDRGRGMAIAYRAGLGSADAAAKATDVARVRSGEPPV